MTFPSRQAILLLICRRVVHRVSLRKKARKEKNEKKKANRVMNEWMNECVHIPIAKEANSNSRRVRVYIYTHTHTLAHWALSFDSTDSSPNSRVYWVKDKRKFFARYCSTIHKKSSTLSKACMHVYKYTERGREWRKERVLIAARGRDYTQEVCMCVCHQLRSFADSCRWSN